MLGIDEEGREILTYIEGQVLVGPEEVGDPVQILTDEQLASAGRLIRCCDAYGWNDRAAVIDEIEARFRRALAWHEKNGKHQGARIFSEMVAWIVEHGPALKDHL